MPAATAFLTADCDLVRSGVLRMLWPCLTKGVVAVRSRELPADCHACIRPLPYPMCRHVASCSAAAERTTWQAPHSVRGAVAAGGRDNGESSSPHTQLVWPASGCRDVAVWHAHMHGGELGAPGARAPRWCLLATVIVMVPCSRSGQAADGSVRMLLDGASVCM